jgi:triacylglycerol lipase
VPSPSEIEMNTPLRFNHLCDKIFIIFYIFFYKKDSLFQTVKKAPKKKIFKKKMNPYAVSSSLSICSLIGLLSLSVLDAKTSKVSSCVLMIVILLEIATLVFDLQCISFTIRGVSRIKFLFNVDMDTEMDLLKPKTNEDLEELIFPKEEYNQNTSMYILDQMARYYRYIHLHTFEARGNTEIVDSIYTENGKQLSCLITKRGSDDMFILFKGTQSAFELQKDFDYVNIQLPKDWKVDDKILVHRGFLELYILVRDRIHRVVDSTKNIYVCGHSLGGALANICLFDLSVNKNCQKIYGLTIGTPRTGNATFAARMSDIRLDQLQNVSDIVPSFPTSWILSLSSHDRILYNYEHAGSIRTFDIVGENLGYAHSLSTYMQYTNTRQQTCDVGAEYH